MTDTSKPEDDQGKIDLVIDTLSRLEEVIEIFDGLVKMFPSNKAFSDTLDELLRRKDAMIKHQKGGQ